MSSPRKIELTEFGRLSADDRRRVLVRACKKDMPTCLGDFTGEEDSTPVFVVDSDATMDVASSDGAVLLAASLIGISVSEPIEVQGDETAYEVWAEPTIDSQSISEPMRLGRACSESEATNQAITFLRDMVGSYVMSLAEWYAIRGPAYELAFKIKRKKAVPIVCTTHVAKVESTWLAAGVYKWAHSATGAPSVISEEEAYRVLDAANTLARVPTERRGPVTFEMRVVTIDGVSYAPFHDLVNAAREGVLLAGLKPWRNVNANHSVIHREFIRFMRRTGWRLPWSKEEPVKPLKLYGKQWIRCAKLVEML